MTSSRTGSLCTCASAGAILESIKALPQEQREQVSASLNEQFGEGRPLVNFVALLNPEWRDKVQTVVTTVVTPTAAELFDDAANAIAPLTADDPPLPVDPEPHVEGTLTAAQVKKDVVGRITALPQDQKKALADWCRLQDPPIRNMLVPRADEVELLLTWLADHADPNPNWAEPPPQ